MDHKQRGDDPRGKTQAPSPRSYGFLLALSRRLGSVAAHSLTEMRVLLMGDEKQQRSDKHVRVNIPMLLKQKAKERLTAFERNAKAKRQSRQNLRRIVRQSQEIVAGANTVFPVTLFPDTIVIDRVKVTITRRTFFWSEEVTSVRIQDILDVSASIGPLFGSLTIAIRVVGAVNYFQVNYFWRKDVMRLKRIIQGYVIAKRNKMDLAHLGARELRWTLEGLGQDSNTRVIR